MSAGDTRDAPAAPEIIDRLSRAIYPSYALLAGMQLDLFTPLKDHPLDTAGVANAVGVNGDRLQPLLYALVVTGLLLEEKGVFSNSPEADRYLVRDSRDFMGDRHLLWSDIWQSAMRTADSIRMGEPQAKHDFNTMTEAELDAFFGGLHPNAVAAGREFATAHDFSACRTVADVGGGSGGFAIGLAQECPNIQVTVVDLQHVTTVTRRFVEAAGADARVSVASANIVAEAVPGEYDAAILKNFIQVLSPVQAAKALRHVFEAMKPGGVVYVTGHILEDSRRAPAESVLFNVVFLNVYTDGRAYTRSEYSEWLTQAGFSGIDFVDEELVVARKPGTAPTLGSTAGDGESD